jgi:hypothetical protein
MKILKQAEQYQTPRSLDWQKDAQYSIASGNTHKYLIAPPQADPASQRLRPGPRDAYLLHTRTHDHAGAWGYHSQHPSLESAAAAAERHNTESNGPNS